jgi:peptidoglycan/LPS O-acetylase OafA/YrhL
LLFAALSVVIYHSTAWYDAGEPGHASPGVLFVFPYGKFGVELFFMISGFVIFMTLERTSNVYNFIVSRIARLYPAFVACLAATIGLILLSRKTRLGPNP